MISPKVYRNQINDLGIEGMIVLAENADEASTLLDELQNVEQILSRIRVNVRMDTRAIRRKYIEKIKKVENASKSIDYKQKIEKSRLKEKKSLILERDMKIASYESIEDAVEDYLIQIQYAKEYLKNIIQTQDDY